MKDFFSLTLCKQLNIAGVPCSILDDVRQGKCVTPSEEGSVAKDKPPIHNHTFKHSVSDSKLGQIHFIQMRNESIPFPYAFFKIHLTPFQRQENILSILTATNSFFLYFNHRIQIQCIINFLPSANSVEITFPSDKQVFGALPHFSRVKIDSEIAQKAKSMQCKMIPCFVGV